MAGEINFGLLDTSAPLKVAGAFSDAQSEARKNRLADLLTQKQERDMADEDAVRAAYKSTGGDQNALLQQLYAGGNYKAAQEVQKQQADLMGKKATTAKAFNDVAHQKIGMYRDALVNVSTPDDAKAWLQAQYQDSDVAPIISGLSPVEKAMSSIPTDPQGFAQWKQQAALGMTKFTEMNKPSIHTQNNGATNDIVAVPGLGGAPTVIGSSRISISPGQAAQLGQAERHFQENKRMSDPETTFTPEAIELAANRYITDGTLPPMGMGKTGAAGRSAILNRAAELSGVDPDQRANQMQFKANSAALNKLQQQETMVSAFERNARKNANMAIELSDKVDRSGVPILNSWIQAGQKSVTGNPELAQFHAANETFVNEYAKIMSGSMGNTAVSDSARAHAHTLLNTAQTPQAYKAVMATLGNEMSNRMAGFAEEKQALAGSMKSKKPSAKNAGWSVTVEK